MDERARKHKAALEKWLKVILKKLIDEYKAEKIILFGSLVIGEIDESTDIDLVIVKRTRKRFLRRSIEVGLLCMAKVGIDYFVYTPKEFRQMAEENPFFQQEVLAKGKVLYEKPRELGKARAKRP
jgi:predicted nucleotidyltransferase